MSSAQKFAAIIEARRIEVTQVQPKPEVEKSIIDRWESLKEVSAAQYTLPNR